MPNPNPNVNKVFREIQPVSEPTPSPEGVDIYVPRNYIYEGESTKTQGYDINAQNHKMVSYRLVIGTDKSLYGILKKNKDIFPNGPYFMDSRDNDIEIHNHKFNQPPKYKYTYFGGNGELLYCSISTKKRTKNVQAEQSSTIDDNKHVVTTVSQTCNDSDTDMDNNSTKGIYESLWSKVTGKPKKSQKEIIIQSAKDEKSTVAELKSTYKVTKQDIEKLVSESKTKFKSLYENAKATGDILPLLKANNINTTVKVKRYVRTTVNPFDYSTLSKNPINTAIPGYSQSDVSNTVGRWYSGMKYLKNSNNVIFLGYHNADKISGTIGYDSFPYADVIMEKEIELELDGARVLSSPLANDIQGTISLNNLSEKYQTQYEGNIKVIGRPGLVSSIVIYLSNISKKYSGEWYTKKVTHNINLSGYTCSADLIPKNLPLTISQVKSDFDTKTLYSKLHNLAVSRTKYRKGIEQAIENSFTEYIKENPEMKDKSLVIDARQYDAKTGTVPIYPATDDIIDINQEREKHRSK